MSHSHFKDQSPLQHVLEKKTKGALSESHGVELSGHLAVGMDAARETAIAFALLAILFHGLEIAHERLFSLFLVFSCGWTIWRAGRSGWLAWFKLERWHRLVEQEKYEIEHNRDQEREELTALYRAKGFEGQLLEDVITVLMADQNRLLKVMVEEELGLSLGVHEHPIKQTIGALIGCMLTSCICLCLIGFWTHAGLTGILVASGCMVAFTSAASAYREKNALIPAIVWPLSLMSLALWAMHFVYKWVNTL